MRGVSGNRDPYRNPAVEKSVHVTVRQPQLASDENADPKALERLHLSGLEHFDAKAEEASFELSLQLAGS